MSKMDAIVLLQEPLTQIIAVKIGLN